MGLKESYRTSVLKKEITDSLIDIQLKSYSIVLWQNQNGIRTITTAKIKNVDFATNLILLAPYSDNDKKTFGQLKANSTFYLRENAKNLVFKQTKPAPQISKDSLQIFIPNAVKLLENRRETRHNLDRHHTTLTAKIDITSQNINVELHNVSLSGMAFFINKKYSRFFFKKDKIKIMRTASYYFARPIIGEIVYTATEYDGAEQIRIGVRFHEKITTDILQTIMI